MTSLPTWIEVSAGVVALTGAMAATWKVSKQGFRGARAVMRLIDILESLNEVLPTLVAIGNEFRANGGSSLKDRIIKLERLQEQQSKDLTAIKAKLGI